ERPVPADGAAQSTAELVLAESRFCPAKLVIEQIVGVELIIPQKLERAAVKFVCAGLDLDVDDSAVGSSELGGVRAGLKLEFLDRIDAWENNHGVEIQFIVVDAVEQEVVVTGSHAVRGNRRGHAPA